MEDIFNALANIAKPCNMPVIISRFFDYNKSVMQRAWEDYKVKKAHKGYEDWTFSQSLYWAHKHIGSLIKSGL